MKVNRWEKERFREGNKSSLLLAGIMGILLVVLLVIYLSIPKVPSGPSQSRPEPEPMATGTVRAVRENFRLSPNGTKIGELIQGAELKVLEDRGAWIKVQVEGWLWKDSTSLSSS